MFASSRPANRRPLYLTILGFAWPLSGLNKDLTSICKTLRKQLSGLLDLRFADWSYKYFDCNVITYVWQATRLKTYQKCHTWRQISGPIKAKNELKNYLLIYYDYLFLSLSLSFIHTQTFRLMVVRSAFFTVLLYFVLLHYDCNLIIMLVRYWFISLFKYYIVFCKSF